jgi:Arc/MetJ-type ribon-helix-helix transcriptional regulator
MSPLNVKVPDDQLRRLDAGIAGGRASSRSEALRLGLERLLNEWDKAAWEESWSRVLPGPTDEFADLEQAAIEGLRDLDADR